MDDTFTSTGGDLRRMLGRSAWTIVVTGSEWEVPTLLSAPWGNVSMSVRSAVTFNGRRDLCQMRVSHEANGLKWSEVNG